MEERGRAQVSGHQRTRLIVIRRKNRVSSERRAGLSKSCCAAENKCREHTFQEERQAVPSSVEKHAERVPGFELAPVATYAIPVAGATVAVEHPTLQPGSPATDHGIQFDAEWNFCRT